MDKSVKWNFTEPPLTIGIDDLVLEEYKCPPFRCHNQNVERTIKDVSAVSKFESDHGRARATIIGRNKQRELMPRFKTKRDYVLQ